MVPADTNQAITYQGIAALLDTKLRGVAKSEDLDLVRADLSAARNDLSEIASRTARNESDIQNLRNAIQNIERKGPSQLAPDRELQAPSMAPQRRQPPFRASAFNAEQEAARVRKFELARRSVSYTHLTLPTTPYV